VALTHLSTIGYEGASVAEFIAALKAAGTTLLLDVRELPISRKPGFAKAALRDALAEAGIEYRHERALGSPKDVRHRLRADGDVARYWRDFNAHLATQQGLLDELAATLSGSVALLCYERDPAQCHRSAVAAELARRTALAVTDLAVTTDAAQTRLL
jgi:uncharacterized protein (DUF488 family)